MGLGLAKRAWKDEQTDAFLNNAAAHGISSGFAFDYDDTHYVRG